MREIPLTQGYVALVDDEDYERVMAAGPWHAKVRRKTVYARRSWRAPIQYLHRLILGLEPGDKRDVDHRDRNGLNNCRSNLRVCTKAENNRNQDKTARNTSGYKGVSLVARNGKFVARIRINGKHLHLGRFHSPITAALEYDKAAQALHGEFASLNFAPKQLAA